MAIKLKCAHKCSGDYYGYFNYILHIFRFSFGFCCFLFFFTVGDFVGGGEKCFILNKLTTIYMYDAERRQKENTRMYYMENIYNRKKIR